MTDAEEGDHVALPKSGRHIFINRWEGLRDVLLRALPEKLPEQRRDDNLPRTTDPQDPARPMSTLIALASTEAFTFRPVAPLLGR